MQPPVDLLYVAQGDAAIYTPNGGSAVDITVLPAQQPDGELPAHVAPVRTLKNVLTVRKSEVASPQRGDVFQLADVVYDYIDKDHANEWEWNITCQRRA